MFLKSPKKGAKVDKNEQVFFKTRKNHGFWSFDFWFLSRGKKAAVNYFLYECKHIIMKKWKY